MDALREVVLPRLDKVRPYAGGYMARCPAHDDGKASLSVSAGKEHPVVLHCHAGCDPQLILDRLHLTWEDLTKPRQAKDEWREPESQIVATYDYVDENGQMLFQVVRMAGKQFRQRVPDPAAKSGWTWKLGDTRRVLYRLPEVITAVREGHAVYICEGEKDVHTLTGYGLVATCNSGGAGKWREEYNTFFRDAVVIIVADNDEPGQAHARRVKDALLPIAASVTIVEAAAGKDATDHVAAGYGLHQLVETWSSERPVETVLAPDLWEFLATPDPEYDWVIQDLLERDDRLMLTGFEGLGKSMLTRQLAVAAAAGLHPFTLEDLEPRRVLLIDCENSERISRRKFRPIAEMTVRLGRRVPDGALRLIHRPTGIDLTQADDRDWLIERVTAHRPDLLFIGPFYRLHNANLNEELPARHTVAALDQARVTARCALVVEAHAGHGEAGVNRPVRPIGSSLLLRWPEFGYGLRPAVTPAPGLPAVHVQVQPWRGPRDERRWPTNLSWGGPGDFPWRASSVEELAEIS